ncbi:MAG: hypothetical protein KDD59_09755 [Bdellovibrionales bacterium]|nr:hypothetical protein [Bdellovibrionales bacterium]
MTLKIDNFFTGAAFWAGVLLINPIYAQAGNGCKGLLLKDNFEVTVTPEALDHIVWGELTLEPVRVQRSQNGGRNGILSKKVSVIVKGMHTQLGFQSFLAARQREGAPAVRAEFGDLGSQLTFRYRDQDGKLKRAAHAIFQEVEMESGASEVHLSSQLVSSHFLNRTRKKIDAAEKEKTLLPFSSAPDPNLKKRETLDISINTISLFPKGVGPDEIIDLIQQAIDDPEAEIHRHESHQIVVSMVTYNGKSFKVRLVVNDAGEVVTFYPWYGEGNYTQKTIDGIELLADADFETIKSALSNLYVVFATPASEFGGDSVKKTLLEYLLLSIDDMILNEAQFKKKLENQSRAKRKIWEKFAEKWRKIRSQNRRGLREAVNKFSHDLGIEVNDPAGRRSMVDALLGAAWIIHDLRYD